MFTNVHESRRRHEQRRPYVPRHQRDRFHADRHAALAVGLALLLVFVAATSANGATRHVAAASAHAAVSHRAAAGVHAGVLPVAAASAHAAAVHVVAGLH